MLYVRLMFLTKALLALQILVFRLVASSFLATFLVAPMFGFKSDAVWEKIGSW